jgi:hypothetical protein
MYMNCTVVSFSDGQDQLDALPSMFVANLAGITQCNTTERYNTEFPSAGEYVQEDLPLKFSSQLPVGSGCGPMSSRGVVNSVQTTATSGELQIPAALSIKISPHSKSKPKRN